MSRETHRPGDLQLAILQVLWLQSEATAGEVHRALAERGLAPTTIATMLRKMEERGLVDHRTQGRQFVYRPLVREDEINRSMVGDLVDRLFRGDPLALIHHLVREGELDLAELESLRRAVDSADDDGAEDVDEEVRRGG